MVTRSEGQISLRGGIIVGAGTITGAIVTVCGVEAIGRTQLSNRFHNRVLFLRDAVVIVAVLHFATHEARRRGGAFD